MWSDSKPRSACKSVPWRLCTSRVTCVITNMADMSCIVWCKYKTERHWYLQLEQFPGSVSFPWKPKIGTQFNVLECLQCDLNCKVPFASGCTPSPRRIHSPSLGIFARIPEQSHILSLCVDNSFLCGDNPLSAMTRRHAKTIL